MASLRRRLALSAFTSLALGATAAVARAQGGQPAGGEQQHGEPVKTPQLDFSGVIFGNYQYRTDSAAKAALAGKSPNQFQIERVYLTFRMPVGDRASIRATTDIFQGDQSNASFYRGWVVRLKYGYLQYDFLKNGGGHQ